MNTYRILRLTSGDEIVCQIFGEGEKTIAVRSPLAIVNVPKIVGDDVEESLSLQRWVHFAESDEFNIDKSQVIVNTGASLGLQRFYQYVLRKLDEDIYEEAEIEDEYEEFMNMESVSDQIH